jgi:hypothetical protein
MKSADALQGHPIFPLSRDKGDIDFLRFKICLDIFSLKHYIFFNLNSLAKQKLPVCEGDFPEAEILLD